MSKATLFQILDKTVVVTLMCRTREEAIEYLAEHRKYFPTHELTVFMISEDGESIEVVDL